MHGVGDIHLRHAVMLRGDEGGLRPPSRAIIEEKFRSGLSLEFKEGDFVVQTLGCYPNQVKGVGF
jgi:hypothetical protein